MNKIEEEFLRESNYIEQVYEEKYMPSAKKAWFLLKRHKRLTAAVILMAHKKLMYHHLWRTQRGQYRLMDVSVGKYQAPSPASVPYRMEEWIKSANQTISGGKTKAEEMIKQDHIAFEKIHPFVDGNGRIGRMLMNWQRLQVGLPILVIKASERWDYYDWFNEK